MIIISVRSQFRPKEGADFLRNLRMLLADRQSTNLTIFKTINETLKQVNRTALSGSCCRFTRELAFGLIIT